MIDRYHRQSLLPQIGSHGKARIRSAHVLLLGVGALGSTLAESLVRAGIGAMTIVDRDVVELTNLQRQTLYADADVGLPKVEAAAKRLRAINADVAITPLAIDVDASNLESLLSVSDGRRVDLILDGSDNAELRYLINDASVRHAIPWVMGGVIGVEGRVAGFDRRGGSGPCLRCVFATPPSAGELATCDTAGVLGPAVGVVASLQAAEAMKMLIGDASAGRQLISLDVWASRFRTIDLSDARRADCPCCGRREFEFLDRPATGGAKLCGRNAVQVRPPSRATLDLGSLAQRLGPIARVDATLMMIKVRLVERPDLTMNVFGDGRMIVFGTTDPALARSMYARVVGG